MAYDKDRQDLADVIAKILRDLPCCQPADGWEIARVTETATTSGCPMIRIEIPHSGTFNVTITRAR
jgi:hypothetical protein